MLAAELEGLGALQPEAARGGVSFRGHRKVIYRVNLESGLATRVLLRVGRFEARRFEDLIDGVAALPWENYLPADVPRQLVVSARKSRLHHTGAIAERAAKAIARRLGDTNAEPSKRGSMVFVRFEHDRATVSVDTSGEPLHRRGYRERTVAAPLREDLAHALVLASGWDRRSALADPMCGAGTIPIEAAALARGLAPGRLRGFAFERGPLLHAPTWSAVKEAAVAKARPLEAEIRGSDHGAEAVTSARLNAERAGVDVSFAVSSVSEAELGGVGALVTHPPFGKRLESGDLTPLYRALGRRAAELPDARVALMVANRRLAMLVDGRLRTAFLTDAGGLKVRALVRPPASS